MLTARASPLRVGPALDRAAAHELRRALELRHFKWDAQIGDVSVLAPFPLLIRAHDWYELTQLAERLAAETEALERALWARPALHARLALPRALRRLWARAPLTPAGARVMRFDFHFTRDGWRVSEVNSDVPGGFTEATSFTRAMAAYVAGARPTGDPTRALVDALATRAGEGGAIALLNAPGHMEDHQVVAHLAAELRARGLMAQVLSLPQLRWQAGRAHGPSGALAAIYRFYQAEWLAALPRASGWEPLFAGGLTPVTNPGCAALTESKRLPLLWDALATPVPTWRRLLPETRALADAPWTRDDGWLIKSAYGNTGDTVFMRAAMTRLEWARRVWLARLQPSQWVAQRRFDIVPIVHDGVPLQPCVGVYVVDGKAAGAYVRLASGPIVDFRARDAALLLYDDP